MKNIMKIIAVLLAAAGICIGADYAAAQTGGVASTKAEDVDSAWNAAAAVKIAFNQTSISVDGSGATVRGNIVTITKAGTYVVSGTLTDGQIRIAATNNDLVRLVLNNTSITCSTGAPIYASQCDKLIVTLAAGTRNTLTDGGNRFVYASTADEEPNAALFSKDDLSINGTGALTVNAGFNNGIGTKDDFVISGGTITVNAANHGLRGNDSLTILGGAFVINSTGDALHSQGDVIISGGDFALTAKDDGIHSDKDLYISGGTIRVLASYEGLEAEHIHISAGTISVVATDDGINASSGTAAAATAGARFGRGGFPGGGGGDYSINISGGNITVRAGSDGLDSNGAINISGGTLVSVTSARSNMGTGAIDADGAVTVSGGTIIYGGTAPGNNFAPGSTQSSVFIDAVIPANTPLSVRSGAATLFTFTVPMECRYLVLSSPAITAGRSYEIYNGTSRITAATAGANTGMGGMGGRGGGRRF
jgi:hypothetical protein